ncbi:MAG: chromate transporter [Bryobacterales bacterium]|nr:chromate transporter [Bryobacterales bacterium]
MAGAGISLATVLRVFGKAGSTTFGGGDPTMAALQREIFEREQWLKMEDYGLCYSIARITPGTNVLAFIAAVGYLLRGWSGAAVAVLAASLPAAIIVVWLTLAFEASARTMVTQRAMAALLAAVTGMMAAAVVLLTKPAVQRRAWLRIGLFTGGTLLMAWKLGTSPITLMALAAMGGALWPMKDAA